VWKVQLFKLNFDEREVSAVADVVRSGWITMGEKTAEFERAFGHFLGNGVRATAVANGTAALHIALLALGVGPGDEVIVPSLTFVADINTVMLVGARPVLADCTSLHDWNIDPADIARKMTSRTKAVIVVHYAGYPCDMEQIVSICERRGVGLIEDCAHAPGALYRGQAVGTFGAVNCFSFFTSKNLSVGEGGMVATFSDELDQQVRYLRSHGMTTLTLDRHKGRAVSYDVVRPGLNYRIDEMRAALGLVQLAKLEEANRLRKDLVARYRAALSDIAGLIIPFGQLTSDEPAYHIFPVLLPAACDRLRVVQMLKDEGVQSSIHYPPFREFTAYSGQGLDETPIAQEVSRRELTLPLYPAMTEEEFGLVVSAFRRSVGQEGTGPTR
jgi:dTDP-4-amino-4,6-dideoxygalactose transaminase